MPEFHWKYSLNKTTTTTKNVYAFESMDTIIYHKIKEKRK